MTDEKKPTATSPATPDDKPASAAAAATPDDKAATAAIATPDDKPASAAAAATPDDKPTSAAAAATPDDKPASAAAAATPDDKPTAEPGPSLTQGWDVPELPVDVARAAASIDAKPDDKPTTAAAADDKSTTTASDKPTTAAAADDKSTTPASDKPSTATAADDKSTTAASDKPSTATAADDKSTTAASDKPTTAAAADDKSATASDKPTPTAAADDKSATAASDKPTTAAAAADKPTGAAKAESTDTTASAAAKTEASTDTTARSSLSSNDLPAVAVETTEAEAANLSVADDELIDWNPSDYAGPGAPDFMLADEDVSLPTSTITAADLAAAAKLADAEPPAPIPATPLPVPAPPVLPSPQEAALEAARIVSQMVDIDSESGAVIAAAAAAGAAIEAAVAAQKAAAAAAAAAAANPDTIAAAGIDVAAGAGVGATAGEPSPRASQPMLRVADIHAAGVAGGTGHDPVTTVRLSRDRILAALANEDAVGGARDTQSRGAEGRVRARTEPGIDEDIYEEFDPVAIAAAAIGRLRARARTDLAELRVHYHRHDILVLLMALVVIVIAGRFHARLVTPANEQFAERGLTFDRPTTFLRPEPLPLIAPRIVRDLTGAAKTKDENLYYVELTAPGSTARLEVLIDKKPTWSNIVTGLELDRRSRWGELYRLDTSSVESIAGHDWLRTAYRYAHVPEKNDDPRVDRAVEFATIDRDQIYVITLYGTDAEIAQLEDVVPPSLRVPTQTGLPLVPQTGRLTQRKYPSGVGRAFDSTVMVVVADLVEGRLRARGGGSGVIVGADGSILTNYHVLHDKDGRLHDTFIIGRFSSPDRAPQLHCAGRPNRSKLLRERDLALIKCDMDLDGRTWTPATSGIWPTLLEARTTDIKMGQRLWVLGYPDVGGGGLTLSTGEVEGWTGEDGAQGKDFIKTDASITHGNSGGPVIDDQGKLVGVAAAFRTRMSANGGVIETSQIGLVRPLGTASNLLAYAAAGWTPREGYTDVELTPSAVEAAAEGVRIYTTVIDDASEAPVRDATVMVLKPGVNTGAIDMNRLDDQAIAWGKTNAFGEVRLKHLVPVPGTYTVMVVAPGYEPLIGENELRLDENTPPSFDPWDRIGLRSR